MCRRLRAAGYEHEDRFRIEVFDALHEGGEIRVGDRHAHRADDLAAGGLEGLLEGVFGVDAGAEIGHHGVDLLDAAFGGRPGAERVGDLRIVKDTRTMYGDFW